MIVAALLLAQGTVSVDEATANNELAAAIFTHAACIKATAHKYALSTETADLVAEAAIAACQTLEEPIRLAEQHLLAGTMPMSDIHQNWLANGLPGVRGNARSHAILIVIDDRAHRSEIRSKRR